MRYLKNNGPSTVYLSTGHELRPGDMQLVLRNNARAWVKEGEATVSWLDTDDRWITTTRNETLRASAPPELTQRDKDIEAAKDHYGPWFDCDDYEWSDRRLAGWADGCEHARRQILEQLEELVLPALRNLELSRDEVDDLVQGIVAELRKP